MTGIPFSHMNTPACSIVLNLYPVAITTVSKRKRVWIEGRAWGVMGRGRNPKLVNSDWIRVRYSNLLLTEREGRTGEYWPEVVEVRTERSEVRTETTESQYSPVRLELARLVSSLLYGTRAMLVLNLPAFENKK